MKLVIEIKNKAKAKKFIELMHEIPYVELKKSVQKPLTHRKKLPEEFYKPLKVKKYIKLNRDEIYENGLH